MSKKTTILLVILTFVATFSISLVIQQALGVSVGSTLDLGGNKIANLGTPSSDNDAVTRKYVDTAVEGSGLKLTIIGAAYWQAVGTTCNNQCSSIGKICTSAVKQVIGFACDNLTAQNYPNNNSFCGNSCLPFGCANCCRCADDIYYIPSFPY